MIVCLWGGLKLDPSTVLQKPIFIIGSPRSGTTVLGYCLGDSTDCKTGDESLFLLHLHRMFADLHSGDNRTHWAPLSAYVSKENILTMMQSFSSQMFLALLKQKENATRYVDHTPWYGILAPFIVSLFPDAHFIHIIRDGRQVVRSLSDSYNKGYTWAGDSFVNRLLLWKKCVQNSLRIKDFVPPNQYIEVRYEDLCSAPQELLTNICSQLHIRYTDVMLQQLKVPHASPSRSKDSPFGQAVDDAGFPVNWTPEEKNMCTNVIGGLLQHLGYQILYE